MMDNLFGEMVEVRRHIHKHPELGECEFATQEYLMNKLTQCGIECEKIAQTGVMAIVRGDIPGKTVGYRADIDALPIQEKNKSDYASVNPGTMHACGHDAHAAIAFGTALYFQEKIEKLKGNIKFFFQPAEETVGGAKRMVDEGCLENPKVDAIFGLHVMPEHETGTVEVKYGTMNASTDTVEILVKGVAGHGAYPHKSVDAILIACQIVVSTQSIISRNLAPTDSGVISFGVINGGVRSNVIADEVKLVATVRSQNSQIRDMLFERIKSLSEGIAISYGGTCQLNWGDDGYPPLVNDDEIVDLIKNAAIKCVGQENIRIRNSQSMGGEDFAYFIENTKGAFYHVGCKIKSRDEYGLHADDFDIDENCMKTALTMNVEIINRLLEG